MADHPKESGRGEARRKRPAKDPTPFHQPLFGTPVRANTSDDLSLSVQKSLGSYDFVKGLKPNELGHLHGVQYQPQTPGVGASKDISQFPIINGQVKVPKADPGNHPLAAMNSSSSSGARLGSQAKGASGQSFKREQSKQAAAGASSSKGSKREAGSAASTTSSQSSSSASNSSSKAQRSSSHDRSKDSAQRRSKDPGSGVRTASKPQSSSATESNSNSQSKSTSSSQSTKADRVPSLPVPSSSSTSKSNGPRPSSYTASRGSASSSSNASDSKTVLHANGLLTQTYSSHSISSHQGTKPCKEAKEGKHNLLDKKDSAMNRGGDLGKGDSIKAGELPFLSPMPEMVKDFGSQPQESFKEAKKERDGEGKQRDGEGKQRPRIDIPKKLSHQGHNKNKEVQKIFEKMTVLKTPVSAIQTPIKAEAPKFPFNEASNSHLDSGSLPSNPRKKLIDALDTDAEHGGAEDTNKDSSLRNDLQLSDESDNDAEEDQETEIRNLNSSNDGGEENATSNSQRQSSTMKRRTDSESSGSESDAEEENTSEEESGSEEESEEESEESEDERPPPSPPKKKSYNLKTLKTQLRQENSQMAPSTPSFKGGPASVENPLSNSRPDTGDGSKHADQSAESGDNDNDDNDSFVKYNNESNRESFTDFRQLNPNSSSANIGKASPSVWKSSKSGTKSLPKQSVSSKPAVKRPQPRTDNSDSSKSSSAKGTSSSPRVKSEPSTKETAKPKTSKQLGKSPGSQSKKPSGPSKCPTKLQEKKTSGRGKPSEKRKQPKSSVYVETDDSDSDDERTPIRAQKASVNTSTSSSSSNTSGLSSGSSAVDTSDSVARPPKLKPGSGKRMPGTKQSESRHTVKQEPFGLFEHHRRPLNDFIHMDPIVSPIRPDFTEEDVRSPMIEHPPEVTYDRDGKPMLIVRLKRDFIDHLPKSGVYKYEPSMPNTSTQRRKDSTDPPEKPSAIVKPVKRKPTDLEKEKSSGRPEAKRSRLENKSPRRMREEALRGVQDEPTEALEPFGSSESALDRRSTSDRRGSVSSLTGHQSSHSNRGRKSDRDHHRSKRDGTDSGRDPGPSLHDWTSPEHRTDRQFTAEDYLAEGKKLKHLADNQVDKHAKALTYFEAVLYLTSCGHAMELDPHVPDEKVVTVYSDTCDIIRFILKLKGIHNGQEGNSNDNKLAVLCYRSQALLNMHMFKLKWRSAMKLSRAVSEYLKGSSPKPQPPPLQQNPTPWSSSNRYTGTPSPVSPTPSPAGSSCSIGSQGSANSDLVPTQTSTASAPPPSSASRAKLCNGLNPQSSPVAMPQRIVNIMSTFVTYANYSLYSNHYWELANALMRDNLEFFLELDRECGDLTQQSSTQELVHYVKRGLSKLRRL